MCTGGFVIQVDLPSSVERYNANQNALSKACFKAFELFNCHVESSNLMMLLLGRLYARLVCFRSCLPALDESF
jgi:hypothetical protein